MATKVRIVHARDWVRATLDGTLDRAVSEQLLDEVAAAARGLTDFYVILDTRRAASALTVTDLWYLAGHFAGLPEIRWRKTAVLVPPERFDCGEFFAVSALSRGLRVRAFTSFEEAIDWLIE
jgi:hypothetical protein